MTLPNAAMRASRARTCCKILRILASACSEGVASSTSITELASSSSRSSMAVNSPNPVLELALSHQGPRVLSYQFHPPADLLVHDDQLEQGSRQLGDIRTPIRRLQFLDLILQAADALEFLGPDDSVLVCVGGKPSPLQVAQLAFQVVQTFYDGVHPSGTHLSAVDLDLFRLGPG